MTVRVSAAGGCGGPPKYLTDEEEEQLEDFLIGSASVGYARSRQQVMQLVGEVDSHKGLASNVTDGWWDYPCHKQKSRSVSTERYSPSSLSQHAVGVSTSTLGLHYLQKCLSWALYFKGNMPCVFPLARDWKTAVGGVKSSTPTAESEPGESM